MELIEKINGAVNSFVWGIPMLVLLVGAGIILTCMTKGLQFRKFGYAMKNTLGKIFSKHEAGEGEITPFQAMTTALAGTVGTGNIAGITTAITLGGPGALLWLWITALIGMCTKYAEVLLAVRFRERNKEGDWVGGPMYYIKNGLGKNWKWLGVIFAVFAALAAFGIGNAVQVGNITSSVNTVITSFNPDFQGQGTVNLVLGIIIAALAAVVLFGGVKRLGAVTEKLVPFMAVIYILACLIVIIRFAGTLPAVFHDIFVGAFNPSSVAGGVTGGMILVLTWGVKRGVFSNEAGLGSAPMAHATTSETDCVKQGLYGIFEVFMDTIIICTLSGLTILCAAEGVGLDLNYGVEGTTALNAAALGAVFTNKGGALIIAIGLALFAFSTILGWALYGTRCCEFLFGPKSIKPYQILFILVIIVGATMKLDLAWAIADTLNGLMALPNLVALIGLSGVVVRETKRHFAEKQDEK
ncbi:MAG: sodium:alanine symporter family protein [Evtepia sp.]|uniref:alanine/glycine:cation symporter family protein n=1 Tax=Evtepia sp. TaxID=2773933 RepID=UPI002A757D6E|nr:sodium:alanine symporter family protein [Evtepia sp.]MDY3014046.1 sodium:alanine symporter family protein [Evtepia sp.]